MDNRILVKKHRFFIFQKIENLKTWRPGKIISLGHHVFRIFYFEKLKNLCFFDKGFIFYITTFGTVLYGSKGYKLRQFFFHYFQWLNLVYTCHQLLRNNFFALNTFLCYEYLPIHKNGHFSENFHFHAPAFEYRPKNSGEMTNSYQYAYVSISTRLSP